MKNKIIVKDSKIEGKGTFAALDINKGEVVLCTKGNYILDSDLDNTVDRSLLEICFQTGKDHHYCPVSEQNKNGIFYVNHSCNPNCGITEKVCLIAMRDIKSGEEITYDYCMTDSNFPGLKCKESPDFVCMCESKDCRKTITGDDWKLKKLQKKYSGYFSKYIEDMIKN
jgi:uncharacterized protein